MPIVSFGWRQFAWTAKAYFMEKKKKKKKKENTNILLSSAELAQRVDPASILRKSTSGCHRPVSYPDGPMTARYRFT